MTSPFTTELGARADAHAREWEAAHDPSVGLEEVQAHVRRRRRGRGLLAAAGGLGCAALVAAVVVAAPWRGTDAVPVEPGTPASAADILSDVTSDDVVLNVSEPLQIVGGHGPFHGVLVVDGEGGVKAKIPYADLMDMLGPTGLGWPVISLEAVDPTLSRAVFRLSNPTAYVGPRVAVVSLDTGGVVVVDPCESTLNSIDVSQWCGSHDGAVVIDPETGEAIHMPEYESCASADVRYGEVVAAMCENGTYESFLVTIDPATGDVLAATSLFLSPVEPPLIVDGVLYVNQYTTEGHPVLVGSNGVSPQVGGGSVSGLAAVGDTMLVLTGSDRFGSASTYGQTIGLWDPATDEFTEVYALEGMDHGQAEVVKVLP